MLSKFNVRVMEDSMAKIERSYNRSRATVERDQIFTRLRTKNEHSSFCGYHWRRQVNPQRYLNIWKHSANFGSSIMLQQLPRWWKIFVHLGQVTRDMNELTRKTFFKIWVVQPLQVCSKMWNASGTKCSQFKEQPKLFMKYCIYLFAVVKFSIQGIQNYYKGH